MRVSARGGSRPCDRHRWPHIAKAEALIMSHRLSGEIAYEWGAMIKALVLRRRC
jgi:hypothetical protein